MVSLSFASQPLKTIAQRAARDLGIGTTVSAVVPNAGADMVKVIKSTASHIVQDPLASAGQLVDTTGKIVRDASSDLFTAVKNSGQDIFTSAQLDGAKAAVQSIPSHVKAAADAFGTGDYAHMKGFVLNEFERTKGIIDNLDQGFSLKDALNIDSFATKTSNFLHGLKEGFPKVTIQEFTGDAQSAIGSTWHSLSDALNTYQAIPMIEKVNASKHFMQGVSSSFNTNASQLYDAAGAAIHNTPWAQQVIDTVTHALTSQG
jgi:hypothetical protein